MKYLALFASTFGITYFAVERAGLFSDIPPAHIQVLYSVPILSSSLLILIAAAVTVIQRRKSLLPRGWVGVAAVVLTVSGLWLGYFTRFSGEVILTEGQTFYSGHDQYLPETVHRGRFSLPPEIGMKFEKITPTFSSDGKVVRKLKSTSLFLSDEKGGTKERTLTDGMPALIDGVMFRLKNFGYSTRYALKSKTGDILDSSFVYMRLFPPGSEGFFRLLSPITYHIRYYPDGKDNAAGPLIGLRIVRNKDIVFNNHVRLSEDAVFENSRISFEEVRMWTVLSVKRDWGELLMIIGLATGLIYLTMLFFEKQKKAK